MTSLTLTERVAELEREVWALRQKLRGLDELGQLYISLRELLECRAFTSPVSSSPVDAGDVINVPCYTNTKTASIARHVARRAAR